MYKKEVMGGIFGPTRGENYIVRSFIINILCLVSYGDVIKEDTSDRTRSTHKRKTKTS